MRAGRRPQRVTQSCGSGNPIARTINVQPRHRGNLHVVAYSYGPYDSGMTANSNPIPQPGPLDRRTAETIFSRTTNGQREHRQVAPGRSVKAGTGAMPQKATRADATLRRDVRLVHNEVEPGNRVSQPPPSSNVQIVPDSIAQEAENRGLEENAEPCLETDLRTIVRGERREPDNILSNGCPDGGKLVVLVQRAPGFVVCHDECFRARSRGLGPSTMMSSGTSRVNRTPAPTRTRFPTFTGPRTPQWGSRITSSPRTGSPGPPPTSSRRPISPPMPAQGITVRLRPALPYMAAPGGLKTTNPSSISDAGLMSAPVSNSLKCPVKRARKECPVRKKWRDIRYRTTQMKEGWR